MTNPLPNGPSGMNPDRSYHGFLPRVGSSYASVVSGSGLALASPSIRSNRVSYLLNPASESTSDLYSSTLPPTRSSMLDAERGNNSPDGDASGPPSRHAQLPSFSRAFEMFMPRRNTDELWATGHENAAFFTPSYLRGSSYITKLEEAHREKQAQKEQHLQATGRISGASPEGPLGGSAPTSHLGISFALIERGPAVDSPATVPLLPTRWNREDKSNSLEVSANGLEVKYNPALRTSREQDHETCAIRADHFMPSQAGIYYFEVTILSKRRDEVSVCVGFISKTVSLARPPGWEPESWGFHGDDGDIYTGGNVGKKYADTYFGSGDVVGCGVNFRTGQAFFTKNGRHLGLAFRDVKGKLYPAVGMKKPGEAIRVNFGQSPFVFNIDDLLETEQNTIKQAISRTSVERIVSPPMKETELIQQLVLQFLQHDGYVETAQEFAQEIYAEQQALKNDPEATVAGIRVRDDDNARQRQRIRRAILEGDIDKALKLTNQLYPHVLKDHPHVYFKLKCRKFIEMVRRAAEFASGDDKHDNGLFSEDVPHPNEMDVDENGFMDNAGDPMDAQTSAEVLLKETIAYGQSLQAEFRDDPRAETEETLNDIFALLAYPNPLEVKAIAPLLDRRGRVTVAEELNSAILSSLGKSSRSALEELYGQTSVLLDILREDGGPGALVSIQSVVDEIPKSQPL
ncbi:ran-binding protein [Xylaria sp. CBS 124048]|nr:ran-binding protein [Xylaria sp. CBS 124048]